MPVKANANPAHIYREAALRHLSSPQQLNHYLSVASPSNWIALMAVLLLFSATAAWSWKGTVTQTVTGREFAGAGGVVSVNTHGRWASRNRHGETGRPGPRRPTDRFYQQPAARRTDPAGTDGSSRCGREAAATYPCAARRPPFRSGRGLSARIWSTKSSNWRQQTVFAAEQVENHQKLYDEGLTTKSTLVAARERLTAIRTDIARHRTQIEQLRAERYTVQADVAHAESDWRERVADLERRLAALREELRHTTSAATSYAGRVVETKIYQGAVVAPGTPLVTIQLAEDKLEGVIYVSSQLAKYVTPGMDVQLSPGNTRPEEHGYLVPCVGRGVISGESTSSQRKLENEALTSP
jgi:HlyD family secretion protein